MSETTLRCPNCGTGNLNTPYIRFSTEKGRKPKKLPIKICRHCDLVIDKSGSMKYFINGDVFP